jgi:hypothetical protein
MQACTAASDAGSCIPVRVYGFGNAMPVGMLLLHNDAQSAPVSYLASLTAGAPAVTLLLSQSGGLACVEGTAGALQLPGQLWPSQSGLPAPVHHTM